MNEIWSCCLVELRHFLLPHFHRWFPVIETSLITLIEKLIIQLAIILEQFPKIFLHTDDSSYKHLISGGQLHNKMPLIFNQSQIFSNTI